MEKILESKTKVISIMVTILIMSGVIGLTIGRKYEQSLNSRQAAVIINEKADKEKAEKEYYELEFEKIRSEFVSSTMDLYKETKNKTDFNFDRNSKERMANAIVKLDNIIKEGDELKVPENINNLKLYSDITDMCKNIERFNTRFVSGIDQKNGNDLNKASEYLKNVNNIIENNKKEKQ